MDMRNRGIRSPALRRAVRMLTFARKGNDTGVCM